MIIILSYSLFLSPSRSYSTGNMYVPEGDKQPFSPSVSGRERETVTALVSVSEMDGALVHMYWSVSFQHIIDIVIGTHSYCMHHAHSLLELGIYSRYIEIHVVLLFTDKPISKINLVQLLQKKITFFSLKQKIAKNN